MASYNSFQKLRHTWLAVWLSG